MEGKNLTAEQSLEIIRESIERSQRTMAKKSALPMLWWGVCVIILALVISYFWKNHGGYMNFLWILIWPLGYVGEWLIGKKQEAIPTPFVGKVIGQYAAVTEEQKAATARTLSKEVSQYFIEQTKQLTQWIEERLHETRP